MQFLEVVRLEGHAFSPEEVALARDMYLLQVTIIIICIYSLKFEMVTLLPFFSNLIFPESILYSYAVVLTKMQWVPVLSLFLHQLMNPSLMKPHCYHLVSVSFHWIRKRLVNSSAYCNDHHWKCF